MISKICKCKPLPMPRMADLLPGDQPAGTNRFGADVTSGVNRNAPPSLPPTSPVSLRLLLLFALAALLVGGSWYYKYQEKSLITDQYNDLQAIARMKINHLLAWRQERLADARLNSSGLIKVLTSQHLLNKQSDTLEEIRSRLHFFQKNEGYYNMVLADAEGKVLVSLVRRGKELEPGEKSLLSRVKQSGEPVFGDFFHCPSCNRVHLGVAAPVLDNDRHILAVLLLIIDPEQELYPLIQSWPLSQHHGETNLGRRDGDAVLVLNQYNAQHSSAHPDRRIPLTETSSPTVRAVLGQHGMLLARDSLGAEVMADLSDIPDTDWVIVTTMGTEPLRVQMRLRGLGILLLLCATVFVAAILFRLHSLSRHQALSLALLRTERERSQAKDEIRATLYGIGDGIIAIDSSGKVTRMNPSAERLTCWREDQALGLPLTEVFRLVLEESDEPFTVPIKHLLNDWAVFGVEFNLLLEARNGGTHPITFSSAPIRAEDGGLSGAVLVIRDQASRRALEKAKAESSRRHLELIENLNDFIWETGRDHRYTFASRRSLDLLGYPPEEIVGKGWLDFISADDDQPENVARLMAMLTRQQPYTHLCGTFVRKDGVRVVLESSATPTFNSHGEFLGYRGISRDITAKIRSEEEHKQLQDQLIQARKMETVGRLAGGVAHDFNNMLTVICSYTEKTLNELGVDHPLHKRLTEVHSAAMHSADLTGQLLAFARKQVIAPKVIDLNLTISGALKMLQRLIGEHIDLQWQPGLDLWRVKMDTTQVGQILANLTVNARDAIDGSGTLHITTRNVPASEAPELSGSGLANIDHVLVTVTDNGIGMDAMTQNNIFDPYFTTKAVGQGTGLGLATVYGIVSQNGGAIHVNSVLGTGTTFKIYLPRTTEEAHPVSNDAPGSGHRGRETILLVEDEALILELATFILKERGYSVLAANCPTMALELAQQHAGPIDLLVTDVIMPAMNGRELAKRMSADYPDAKVLFVSGYTADMISSHGVLESDFQFLEKPFTPSSLAEKVRSVLDCACASG